MQEVKWKGEKARKLVKGTKSFIREKQIQGMMKSSRDFQEKVHGGYGLSFRNDARKKVLDFATAYDLAIVNTYFRKKKEHYVTYKNGRNKSQIDYFMVRTEKR
ncbi:craniofacial development protein 2-like [Aphis craccivora]|uniref:Craniofacial development protein 2-like n=1 Tax=Aphis craccivora TaxID=307492 RepID=A0A6G0Z0J4_APHCR|nr:craniofacial development protein 2-like [Aphis craccivora]